MDEYDGDEPADTTPPCLILAPLNKEARKAVDHVRNNYHRCRLDHDNNTFGLLLDFSDLDRQEYTLGCSETDIHLPDVPRSKSSASSQISDHQATISVVQSTGAVLLRDYSDHHSTETYSPSHSSSTSGHGGVAVKFRSSRSILLARGINPRIGFGRDKYYQFEVRWRSDGLYSFIKYEPYVLGPRHSKQKKYVEKLRVGGGAYGEVWSVLDITNGELIAVKKFRNLTGKNLDFATREVANLFKISKHKSIQHEHILQIYDYAGGDDGWGEIFMPLMDGNIKTLMIEGVERPDEIAETVLRQMLLALQCIASHSIVHRDIKPENILWQFDAYGNYHFCLCDFGLSNDPKLARTVAGTEPFMAPEVYNRHPQTTKVDIWSLFATYIWIQNTEQFRDWCSQYSVGQIHKWLVRLSELPQYANIKKMASYDPKKRPSAAHQLAILDGDVEETPSDAGYDGPGGDLDARFQGMNLGDGQYDPGSSGSTAPETPYYEPYPAPYQPYDGDDGQPGSSKQYTPAPMGSHGPGEFDQAFVAMYGTPYVRREDNDSGTAVPDMWTQRQMPTTSEEPAYPDPAYPSPAYPSQDYQQESNTYQGASSSAYQGEPGYQDSHYQEEPAYVPEPSYRAERDPRRSKHKGKHRV
ncbi:kinase-like domain-containing protein [Immersiella caudata]|uniref:Kinase-like domain-containing protein n=1 Tax=Immersiella caudata TaxID=314043 RepID=A0AA40BUS8_9PEZI|nr:kinase-like domain-containing protein [Immersiella caudata]